MSDRFDAGATRAGVWSAVLLGAQFALMWTTFFILSSAIGWPASLGDPANVTLPRILAEAAAVQLGYGLYLAAAILLLPATAALCARLGRRDPLAMLAIAVATLAVMFKAIGIGRWLLVMPVLAEAYAGGENRSLTVAIFQALNDYAGGIGELLGVALAGAGWSFTVAALLADRGGSLLRCACWPSSRGRYCLQPCPRTSVRTSAPCCL